MSQQKVQVTNKNQQQKKTAVLPEQTPQKVQKDTAVSSQKANHSYKFESNSNYFTICVYGLAFVTLATLIIILLANWKDTSSFFTGVFHSLTPFVIAFFIAYILNPFVKMVDRTLARYVLKDRMRRGRKLLSIALVYIMVIAIIAIAILFITPEIITSIEDIKDVYAKVNISEIEANISNLIQSFQTKYPDLDLQFVQNKVNELIPHIFSYSTNIATNLVSISFSIVKTLINLLLAIVISCYMLSDKLDLLRNGKRVVYSIFSKTRASHIIQTSKECNSIFSKFIIGKSIDSLIIGIICFIVMTILRLDYAILFSIFVGITNMIPYFGPFIGGIPGVIIYLFISPVKSLIFAIMIFALQQFDGLYLGPKILGESTGLTPLWVIFGITLGGAYFGVIGMFLGVPITAVIAYLLNKQISNRLKNKNINI